MTVLLAFAFLSGVITILSPCILPVLPIVLSGSVGKGKARPFGVISGFIASFTAFTLALTAIVQALGVPADTLRYVAVVLIVLLGLFMVVPKLRNGYELLASRIVGRSRKERSTASGRSSGGVAAAGFWSGVPVGFSLGVVWTPCVGPIMASVISLALTQRVDGGAVFIALAYTIGTSLPMLAVMLGGRALLIRVPVLARNTIRIQKGFGVLMILVGVAIGFGWDRQIQNTILKAFPGYGTGLTTLENAAPVRNALEAREFANSSGRGNSQKVSFDNPPKNGTLGDYGPAPPIVAGGRWFNTEGLVPSSGNPTSGGSPPLTMEDLKGKVVIVDFWTYSCVNCVRTIPYLKSWYDSYRDQGLVIIGVHTPEFEFEKSPANVGRAIRELGVDWPVVQDNNYAQWNAYSNRYWPAHYFIDARGRVRYFHFGEGEYNTSERVIRALLKEAGSSAAGGTVSKPPQPFTARTPETYLGYEREHGFISAAAQVPGLVPDEVADYTPSRTPGNGEWSLRGKWSVSRQYILPQPSGVLELGFYARDVFLVIEPEEPGGRIEVRVDGQPVGDTEDVRQGVLNPGESRLYQLVGLDKAGEHLLHLDVEGKLRLFAFTFG